MFFTASKSSFRLRTSSFSWPNLKWIIWNKVTLLRLAKYRCTIHLIIIDYLLIYIGKKSKGEVAGCAWNKNILLSFKNQLTSVLRHCMFLSFWYLSIFILKMALKKSLKVLSFFSLVNSQGLHPFLETHTRSTGHIWSKKASLGGIRVKTSHKVNKTYCTF